ncbi:MAG: putative hydroxyacylglutathione hydrolase [Candidatus Scalindua rubra]|uniref:Putative hydroxyacylglutathione hydrolase n=1 Tax=Candidatus Scalindua rubra TaxID=1872076 RepID=A0A1E3XGF1_9BACT|nr:MAG: putative hydroxyacylglutathione hydrolase [Candidatus Scalindua rubra]
MLNIQKFELGPLEACCYIISTRISSKAVIIDPGEETDKIIDYINKKKLDPIILINTHGHGDHIGGNKELKKRYPDIQICVHNDDAEMLTDPYKNLSLLSGKRYVSPPANRILNHNDKIMFDEYTFRILHLPGHTSGGIGIYTDSTCNGEAPVLFSGDTLFAGGIGRTDLPGGSYHLLIQSIKQYIFTLDENTIIHPGHGSSTTVEVEKERFNFF